MPTIKDVAKKAGVSHGTVSNVINGTKSVHSDIIKRVEKAMAELQYQPNDRARSLRSSKSNIVGVILPNITDNIHSYIFTGIQNILSKHNKNIILYITDDKKSNEKIALQKLQQKRAEITILITCMPNDKDFFDSFFENDMKLLFLRRKPQKNIQGYFLELDEKSLMENAVKEEIKNGHTSFLLLTDKKEYSNERHIVRGFLQALKDSSLSQSQSKIYHYQLSEDAMFRICVKNLMIKPTPQVIFTTNAAFAKIAKAACNLFCEKMDLPPIVIGISNDSWAERYSTYENRDILYDFEHFGDLAGKKALSILSKQPVKYSQKISSKIPEEISTRKTNNHIRNTRKKTELKILTLEGMSSNALQDLSIKFKNTTNIDISTKTYTYEKLNSTMVDIQHSFSDFDVIQVNNPALCNFAKNNLLVDLSKSFDKSSLDYSKEILNYYSLCENKIYAIPYMLGSQMLFFKKDLFENFRLQRLFFEKHNKDLEIPKTWKDYDTLAEFFTKKYNPLSPVKYGSAFCGNFSIYSLLPRLWEKSINFFDDAGNFVFSELQAIPILKELKKSLQYSDKKSLSWGWKEQAKCFLEGDAAMMISYHAHFIEEHTYQKFPFIDDIGIAKVPSTHFIRGGWSLAINAHSKNIPESIEFLQWFSKKENIVLHNLLGGSIPAKNILSSGEANKKNPWFIFGETCLSDSKPMLPKAAPLQQFKFEKVIEPILYKFLSHELSVEKTAHLIHATIQNELNKI